MMDPKMVENVKKLWGYTDEQIEGMSPKSQRIIETGDEFRKWRMVKKRNY